MFLCSKCHPSNCEMKNLELRSSGRCEDCGTNALCFDCHGYKLLPLDAPRKPPKKVQKKRLN